MLARPSAEQTGLTPKNRAVDPSRPAAEAKVNAWFGCKAPRTKGRFRVLVICESKGGSSHMLYALALAQQSQVPEVRKKSVGRDAAGKGERDTRVHTARHHRYPEVRSSSGEQANKRGGPSGHPIAGLQYIWMPNLPTPLHMNRPDDRREEERERERERGKAGI